MSSYRNDTIAALATPFGESAIAVIRLSGENLTDLLSSLSGGKVFTPRFATYAPIYSQNTGEILDNCIITYFKAPQSYTGEDVVEISCHGGDFVPKSILLDLYARNVRAADPGEFSFRAFMNGKIDLVQAEAISSLISCKTQAGASLNLTNLSGKLSANIGKLKKDVVEVLSLIELELDFSEEEVSLSTRSGILLRLNNISNNLKSSLKTAVLGKIISSGIRVVLFGLPNTGKSNLFNNILGHERAIVSPIPGTTRDTIESWIDLDGFPVCLIDTAGVWETKDFLETIGIEKTLTELGNADIVLFVDDKDPKRLFEKFHIKIEPDKVIFVKTKEDILPTENTENIVSYTSSKKDEGFNKLLTSLSTLVRCKYGNYSGDVPALTSGRQHESLKRAKQLLSATVDLINEGVPMDIIASSLRSFVLELDEVLGEVSSKDIVENIFKSFCVGK